MKQTQGTEMKEPNMDNITVEEAFAQLSDIVEQMDAPEVTLEASMELYRKGVGLLAQCGETLDRIEKEMITLTEEGEMPGGEAEGTSK